MVHSRVSLSEARRGSPFQGHHVSKGIKRKLRTVRMGKRLKMPFMVKCDQQLLAMKYVFHVQTALLIYLKRFLTWEKSRREYHVMKGPWINQCLEIFGEGLFISQLD